MKNQFDLIKAMLAAMNFEHLHNGLDESHGGCFFIDTGEPWKDNPTFAIHRRNDGELAPSTFDEPVTLSYGSEDNDNVYVYFDNIVKLVEAFTMQSEDVDNLVVAIVREYKSKLKNHDNIRLWPLAIFDVDSSMIVRIIWTKNKFSTRAMEFKSQYPKCVLIWKDEICELMPQWNELMS